MVFLYPQTKVCFQILSAMFHSNKTSEDGQIKVLALNRIKSGHCADTSWEFQPVTKDRKQISAKTKQQQSWLHVEFWCPWNNSFHLQSVDPTSVFQSRCSTFHQNKTSLHQTTFRKTMARDDFHLFHLFFFVEKIIYLIFSNKKVPVDLKTVLFIASMSFISVNCANFAVEEVVCERGLGSLVVYKKTVKSRFFFLETQSHGTESLHWLVRLVRDIQSSKSHFIKRGNLQKCSSHNIHKCSWRWAGLSSAVL